MKIVFTGGGTGGHLFPLISVARELNNLLGTTTGEVPEIIFLGPDDFPIEILSQENIKVSTIIGAKLRRYFSFKNFLDMFIKLPIAFIQAFYKLFILMPDLVFSKGGYGSVPVVMVAWIFRIPVIIHESDAISGLANRIGSKFAKRVAISFEESAKYFNAKKTAFVGNPIRWGLLNGDKEEALRNLHLEAGLPILFIYGGSQGAQVINNIIIEDIKNLLSRYEVIHQCGELNYNEVQELLKKVLPEGAPQNYHLYPFMLENQMKDAYVASDLIIGRAGSGTIFEIAALGKPSIIIPLNGSASEHQRQNAIDYARTGAAEIIEQDNLTASLLASETQRIISDKVVMLKMANAALDFSKPDAAKKIAEEMLSLIK